MEVKLCFPHISLPSLSCVDQISDHVSPYKVLQESKASLKNRMWKLDPSQVFGTDHVASKSPIATRTINGKFEGYFLIVVVVGTKKLFDVHYHVFAKSKFQQYESFWSLINSIRLEENTRKSRDIALWL